MLVRIGYRPNGLVGANSRTHAAANAHLINGGMLADTDKMTIFVAAFLFQHIQLGQPLPAVGQINCLLGTDGRALPAQGTTIFPVLNDPGQIAVG
jgi:hypothetical protein